MKHPDAVEQIAEPRSLKSVGAPFDLVHRASPGFVGKYGPIPFGKFAVKGSIMGNDDCGIRDKRADGIAIDFMAGGHFVGDAVQLDGFFGDRSGGLVERTKGIEDGSHRAVWMIGEFDNAEFDHLVGRGV